MKGRITLYSNFFTCINIFFSGDQLLHGRTLCRLAESLLKEPLKNRWQAIVPWAVHTFMFEFQKQAEGFSYFLLINDRCMQNSPGSRMSVYSVLEMQDLYDCIIQGIWWFLFKKLKKHQLDVGCDLHLTRVMCSLSTHTRNFRSGQLYRCEKPDPRGQLWDSIAGSRCSSLLRSLCTQLPHRAEPGLGPPHQLGWPTGASSVWAEAWLLLWLPLAPQRRAAMHEKGQRRRLNEIMGNFRPLLHSEPSDAAVKKQKFQNPDALCSTLLRGDPQVIWDYLKFLVYSIIFIKDKNSP